MADNKQLCLYVTRALRATPWEHHLAVVMTVLVAAEWTSTLFSNPTTKQDLINVLEKPHENFNNYKEILTQNEAFLAFMFDHVYLRLLFLRCKTI